MMFSALAETYAHDLGSWYSLIEGTFVAIL